jgi:hypothetical protein
LAVFVIVLISFLVSLNRNAHNIDDEIWKMNSSFSTLNKCHIIYCSV